MRHRATSGHQLARPWRRVAACMLVVQVLMMALMALPRVVTAVAGPAQAASGDALAWVMVCTPQGMQQVALKSLFAADADAHTPAEPADNTSTSAAGEPSDPGPQPASGNGARTSHCLLCQPATPVLPVVLAAFLLLPPAPEVRPDSAQTSPVAQAQPWCPLLARPPPTQR